jgi:hypothetical protein
MKPGGLERDRSGRETRQSIGAKGPGPGQARRNACGRFALYSLQRMEFVRFMKRAALHQWARRNTGLAECSRHSGDANGKAWLSGV